MLIFSEYKIYPSSNTYIGIAVNVIY